MERQTIRMHRIGSITFGGVLVVTGILFLLHVFFPTMDYEFICHFWPMILISLGVEVLLGSRRKSFEIRDGEGRLVESSKVVYDVAAILLTMALTIFAMVMGLLDYAMNHAGYIWY